MELIHLPSSVGGHHGTTGQMKTSTQKYNEEASASASSQLLVEKDCYQK